MNRHWLFRNYWWIATGTAVGGLAVAACAEGSERFSIAGSVLAGALGFAYFVQRQMLSETQLFRELFTEFNARYDKLNDGLLHIVSSGEELSEPEIANVIDYFNLCGEEYLYYRLGYIPPLVWGTWSRGMQFYLKVPVIRSLWAQECTENSYYGLSSGEIDKGANLPH